MCKRFTRVTSVVFVLLFTLLFNPYSFDAKSSSKVTELKQVSSYTNSISLEWKKVNSATHYQVCISEDEKDWEEFSTQSNSYFNCDLDPGTTYYVKVRACTNPKSGEHTYGDFSDTLKCVTTPEFDSGAFRKVKSKTTTLNVIWTSIDGATGYRVEYFYYDSNGKEKVKSKLVNSNTAELTDLVKNTKYYFRIYPYRKASGNAFKAMSEMYIKGECRVTPTKPKIEEVTINRSIREVVYRIKHSDLVDGYRVQIKTIDDKSLYDNSVKGSYNSFRKPILGTNKIFKMRVRAYVTDGVTTSNSSWSSWKYFSQVPSIKKLSVVKGGIKISWNKVKDADSYVIYSYNMSKGTSTKVATVNGSESTYKVTKIGTKALKNKKTYYFYVVPYKKVNDTNHKLTSDKSIKSLYYKKK